MKKEWLIKTIIIGIIVLFISSSVVPVVSSNIDFQNIDENILDTTPISMSRVTSSLTFYTFDRTGIKQNNVEISNDVAVKIKNSFDELRHKIVYEPNSIETQELKNSFINLLDENCLLSEKQSKQEVLSLLNPSWLKLINKIKNFKGCDSSSNYLIGHIFNSYFIFNVFCTITSAGTGRIMPLFMLPRPRTVAFWYATDAMTSAANLLTGIGFFASGRQGGILLGFIGIGLTYAVPGASLYGFIGYTIFMNGFAEYIY